MVITTSFSTNFAFPITFIDSAIPQSAISTSMFRRFPSKTYVITLIITTISIHMTFNTILRSYNVKAMSGEKTQNYRCLWLFSTSVIVNGAYLYVYTYLNWYFNYIGLVYRPLRIVRFKLYTKSLVNTSKSIPDHSNCLFILLRYQCDIKDVPIKLIIGTFYLYN